MIYIALSILILGLLQIYKGKPLVSINTGTQWNTWNDTAKLEQRISELQHQLHIAEHQLAVEKMRTPLEKLL